MGIRQMLTSQGSNPHGPLGRIMAWTMPLLSDTYYGDLASLLDLEPQDDVLDVACGSGVFLQKTAPNVRHVAGIDQSEIQVRIARRRNRDLIGAGRAEIVQGDGTSLPWADASFSAVTSNCLGCFDRPQHALQEMFRVLRPGGRAAFSLNYFPDELTAQKERQKWGLSCWTEAEFCQLLEDTGFSGVSTSPGKNVTFAKASKA